MYSSELSGWCRGKSRRVCKGDRSLGKVMVTSDLAKCYPVDEDLLTCGLWRFEAMNVTSAHFQRRYDEVPTGSDVPVGN
jgi:hypothetical protein